MRRVLLCMLEAVEGGSCLLKMPDVIRCVLLCMLEAVEGALCLLEVMRRVCCCVSYAGGGGESALFAGGDAPCVLLCILCWRRCAVRYSVGVGYALFRGFEISATAASRRS